MNIYYLVSTVMFLVAPALALAESVRVILPPNAPEITSHFHSMKAVNGGWRRTRHQGIDIPGPNRQPVIAVADGRVLDASVGSCWGPTVTVDHGLGRDGQPLIVLYGHLGTFAVQAGDRIKRGALVGRLGNNFRKFRCIGGVRHLHLQIGRKARLGESGTYWGHLRFLEDGRNGVNPHMYWAGGIGRVTCFNPRKNYPEGTLTYPVPCR